MKIRGILPLLLTVVLLAGCAPNQADRLSDKQLPPPRSLAQRASDSHAVNPDTAGWLYIPDAGIDAPFVHLPGERNATNKYLRQGFDGKTDGVGWYFADGRATFGSGTRSELARLTAIYGYSGSDDPSGGMFSGLKYYRDEAFAREHPYLFCSTLEEDMVFEVVAVFEAHVNLPYNRPDLEELQAAWMLDAVRDCSLYHYTIPTGTEDTLLVLSTAVESLNGRPDLDPFLAEYRFAVMGKLVPEGETLKSSADFRVNPAPAPPDKYDHTDWMWDQP